MASLHMAPGIIVITYTPSAATGVSAIFIGERQVNAIYYGATAVRRVYLGDKLIFESD